jgi:DNA primase
VQASPAEKKPISLKKGAGFSFSRKKERGFAMGAPNMFELARTIPALEIIRYYGGIELKRRGRVHVGCCPFHEDRNPSFTVFPDNYWKCFGCGEGGSAIDFVALLFKITPFEAAKRICEDFGLLSGICSQDELRRVRERLKELKKRKKLRQEAAKAHETLALLYRTTSRALQRYSWKGYNGLALLVHKLPLWEYLLDALTSRDEETVKAALMHEEVKRWVS